MLPWKSNITYSEHASVASRIQQAKLMRRILLSSVACLVLPYFSIISHNRNDFFGKKISEHKCVFWYSVQSRLRLKCDGTRTETLFRLSPKRTIPFKSAGASVYSITGSRGVRISGSNAGYTIFQYSVKSTGYPLHSPVSLSLSLPCVNVWHHISTGLYVSNISHSKRNSGIYYRKSRLVFM